MTGNPDLLQHPNQPLKMNRYDGEDYNLYWLNNRAGWLDHNPQTHTWTCHLAVTDAAGNTLQYYDNTFSSVAQAIQELRNWQPEPEASTPDSTHNNPT